jgi:uncharacterized protein YciI
MAAFVALLTFGEDEELRLRTRPAHREYLRELFEAGRLRMSGPWADDTGAMLIYEAVDLDEAKSLLDRDPYRTAGVVADARLREWRIVLPPPEV